MKFFKGIGLLFFLSAIAFLVASVLVGNSALDIPMHDVYFVIAKWQLYIFVMVILIIIATIYSVFNRHGKPLNKVLGISHFVGTAIPFAVIFFLMSIVLDQHVPRRFYSFDAYPTDDVYSDLNKFITIAVLVFFAAQLLFIANIFLTLFRRKTK